MSRAIGMIEFKTVSAGITAADRMVKTADVELLEAQTVCPGKYIALIAGDITGEGACDAEDAGIICDYEAMAIDTLMDLAAVCEAVYSYNN